MKRIAAMFGVTRTARPNPDSRTRFPRGAALVAALALAAACGPTAPKTDIRQWTQDMMFRISTSVTPPHARERTRFKVVVLDKESREPIEHGEGRLFAMNADSSQVWDGLEHGPEPGTYYATLNFVTAGQWAIGLEFRRDSTKKLERMDWTQDVRAERP